MAAPMPALVMTIVAEAGQDLHHPPGTASEVGDLGISGQRKAIHHRGQDASPGPEPPVGFLGHEEALVEFLLHGQAAPRFASRICR